MKNNYLHKKETRPISILLSKRPVCIIGLMLGLFTSQNSNAQLVNQTDMKIDKNAIMAVYMDYQNGTSGNLINNGNLYIFQNWRNDGIVNYNDPSSGFTFFYGEQEQLIEGSKIANFNNIAFNNLTSLVPFHLKTSIEVGKNVDFLNGIINAGDYNGKVIFDKNASYSIVSDNSFVDGAVEKKGLSLFQYPIGNALMYRPLIGEGTSGSNDYTSQYFFENSESEERSHNKKEKGILEISKAEYWQVTKESGDENIVLSLTLDTRTTPSQFFAENPKTEVAIVRWDEQQNIWVKEGGVVSDPLTNENYSKLLTSQVHGYGIFTMALVDKVEPVNDNVVVYNGVSPNGDGLNDFFRIDGLDEFPDNSLEIFNRWGVKVYETSGYGLNDNWFRGFSEGRVTVNKGDKLPTGTYFYILNYKVLTTGKQKVGYLYIN